MGTLTLSPLYSRGFIGQRNQALLDNKTLAFISVLVLSMICSMQAYAGKSTATCSPSSAQTSSATFINNTASDVTLIWLDTKCKEKSYGAVKPSQSKVITTYFTHQWRIKDNRTKAIINQVTVNQNPITIYANPNLTPPQPPTTPQANTVTLPLANEFCNYENSACSLPPGMKATVYYGANDKFFVKTGLTGTIACNNTTFGDPIGGVVKACYLIEEANILPAEIVNCAGENGTCQLPNGVTATVYYGANGKFVLKRALQDSIPCNPGYFGDPIYGTVKSCFYSRENVKFFEDGFERTTLNNSTGSVSGIIQNQLSERQSDIYLNTRFWDGGNFGLELQGNEQIGFNAHSGRHMVELDTTQNSTMSTKLKLVPGKSYILRFHYRSRTQGLGDGILATIYSPSSGFSTMKSVSDSFGSWSEAIHRFDYLGTSSEAVLSFAASGPSSGIGVVLDDISVETSISGSLSKPSALIGILPPHVPGLTSNDLRRNDIITPIVANKDAAIALGKALFWDQAVGSDHMACASCHFHAGADNRTKNQVNPGTNHNAASGQVFNITASGNQSGPNYTLNRRDFPFDPSNDDIISSSGTFSGDYKGSYIDINLDDCARSVDTLFHVNGVGVRRVEPRNSPTMINAAYNHRNFWDGRANNEFNGLSPFGSRDSTPGVFINKNGTLIRQPLKLKNASLASQAVGPVDSDFEMACRSRQFADVGRKLLSRSPLSFQRIAPDDSVLSSLPQLIGTQSILARSLPSTKNSIGTYSQLIKIAFAPEYWNGNCNDQCGKPNAGVLPSLAYSHMEANFSMFFGIAVQMYEETLVSDDSRFDQFKSGVIDLTASEKNGERIFNGKAGCNACHNGPTMTNAAILHTDENVIEGMLMSDKSYKIYDRGFYNLGVVPTEYGIAAGGNDPWGNTLTLTRQYIQSRFIDNFGVEPCKFSTVDSLCTNDSSANRAQHQAAVDGAFKVPTLRNVELTGPYMHNGSLMNLEQVVDFYNHGGNFNNPDKSPDIKALGLSTQEKADLVAFMKTFTDDRVKYEKAPFDHPSLSLPVGAMGSNQNVTPGTDQGVTSPFAVAANLGVDLFRFVPAVGRLGNQNPLPTFEAGLQP